MYFEQFYLGCLAHASYMLGSEGEAAVIDPQRDVEIYLKAADLQGLKIRHIFETHLHADFVSGHLELAKRTGAKIYIGAQAGATFPHVALHDGSELRFGKLLIRALETPGHTPEGVCLVVTDEEKSWEPWAVLTGDTLFIGDVGRPAQDWHHHDLLRLPGLEREHSLRRGVVHAADGGAVDRGVVNRHHLVARRRQRDGERRGRAAPRAEGGFDRLEQVDLVLVDGPPVVLEDAAGIA